MSSPESQKILAAYARYKQGDVNRNNKAKFQEQLRKEQQKATETLNKLQSQYAPSQQIRQNFRTIEEINAARQKALAAVAANPPSSGGRSRPRTTQEQAAGYAANHLPVPPTEIIPAPTVGTITRTVNTYLQRLPEIPTTREEYNAIYKRLSDAKAAYAKWIAETPRPRSYTWSGGWTSTKVRRARESRAKVESWERKKGALQSKIRSAQIHWDQTSRGQKEIEIHIKALSPYLELESFTRPEIAASLTAITAASNSIGRLISQKQFVERARLSTLQKLMLLVTNKRAKEIELSAAAMRQNDFVIVQTGGHEVIETLPPATNPPPEIADPQFNLARDIGEAFKGIFGGSQEELNAQAIMVAKANIAAAKALARKE